MPMRVFADLEELRTATGEVLGPSDWITVDQAQINAFADATGDHQWIHVDPERAASGPFGTTIAHGFLTLSLMPVMLESLYKVQGVRMGVNYGLNRVRFPAPVPADSRLRASAEVAEVSDVAGGAQLVLRASIERDGGEKPVCVAEFVIRIYL
jgi:acyl dehydratase